MAVAIVTVAIIIALPVCAGQMSPPATSSIACNITAQCPITATGYPSFRYNDKCYVLAAASPGTWSNQYQSVCVQGVQNWFPNATMAYGRTATFPDDQTMTDVTNKLVGLAMRNYTGTDGSDNGGSPMPQTVWIGAKAPTGSGCVLSDYCWMATETNPGSQLSPSPIPFPGTTTCSSTTNYCIAGQIGRTVVGGQTMDGLLDAYPHDCSTSHSVICEFGCQSDNAVCPGPAPVPAKCAPGAGACTVTFGFTYTTTQAAIAPPTAGPSVSLASTLPTKTRSSCVVTTTTLSTSTTSTSSSSTTSTTSTTSVTSTLRSTTSSVQTSSAATSSLASSSTSGSTRTQTSAASTSTQSNTASTSAQSTTVSWSSVTNATTPGGSRPSTTMSYPTTASVSSTASTSEAPSTFQSSSPGSSSLSSSSAAASTATALSTSNSTTNSVTSVPSSSTSSVSPANSASSQSPATTIFQSTTGTSVPLISSTSHFTSSTSLSSQTASGLPYTITVMPASSSQTQAGTGSSAPLATSIPITSAPSSFTTPSTLTGSPMMSTSVFHTDTSVQTTATAETLETTRSLGPTEPTGQTTSVSVNPSTNAIPSGASQTLDTKSSTVSPLATVSALHVSNTTVASQSTTLVAPSGSTQEIGTANSAIGITDTTIGVATAALFPTPGVVVTATKSGAVSVSTPASTSTASHTKTVTTSFPATPIPPAQTTADITDTQGSGGTILIVSTTDTATPTADQSIEPRPTPITTSQTSPRPQTSTTISAVSKDTSTPAVDTSTISAIESTPAPNTGSSSLLPSAGTLTITHTQATGTDVMGVTTEERSQVSKTPTSFLSTFTMAPEYASTSSEQITIATIFYESTSAAITDSASLPSLSASTELLTSLVTNAQDTDAQSTEIFEPSTTVTAPDDSTPWMDQEGTSIGERITAMFSSLLATSTSPSRRTVRSLGSSTSPTTRSQGTSTLQELTGLTFSDTEATSAAIPLTTAAPAESTQDETLAISGTPDGMISQPTAATPIWRVLRPRTSPTAIATSNTGAISTAIAPFLDPTGSNNAIRTTSIPTDPASTSPRRRTIQPVESSQSLIAITDSKAPSTQQNFIDLIGSSNILDTTAIEVPLSTIAPHLASTEAIIPLSGITTSPPFNTADDTATSQLAVKASSRGVPRPVTLPSAKPLPDSALASTVAQTPALIVSSEVANLPTSALETVPTPESNPVPAIPDAAAVAPPESSILSDATTAESLPTIESDGPSSGSSASYRTAVPDDSKAISDPTGSVSSPSRGPNQSKGLVESPLTVDYPTPLEETGFAYPDLKGLPKLPNRAHITPTTKRPSTSTMPGAGSNAVELGAEETASTGDPDAPAILPSTAHAFPVTAGMSLPISPTDASASTATAGQIEELSSAPTTRHTRNRASTGTPEAVEEPLDDQLRETSKPFADLNGLPKLPTGEHLTKPSPTNRLPSPAESEQASATAESTSSSDAEPRRTIRANQLVTASPKQPTLQNGQATSFSVMPQEAAHTLGIQSSVSEDSTITNYSSTFVTVLREVYIFTDRGRAESVGKSGGTPEISDAHLPLSTTITSDTIADGALPNDNIRLTFTPGHLPNTLGYSFTTAAESLAAIESHRPTSGSSSSHRPAIPDDTITISAQIGSAISPSQGPIQSTATTTSADPQSRPEAGPDKSLSALPFSALGSDSTTASDRVPASIVPNDLAIESTRQPRRDIALSPSKAVAISDNELPSVSADSITASDMVPASIPRIPNDPLLQNTDMPRQDIALSPSNAVAISNLSSTSIDTGRHASSAIAINTDKPLNSSTVSFRPPMLDLSEASQTTPRVEHSMSTDPSKTLPTDSMPRNSSAPVTMTSSNMDAARVLNSAASATSPVSRLSTGPTKALSSNSTIPVTVYRASVATVDPVSVSDGPCQFSDWTPYSACGATCGSQVYRQRTRIQSANRSGTCSAEKETSLCDLPECNPMSDIQKKISRAMMNIACIWVMAATGLSIICCACLRNRHYLQVIHACEDVALFLAHLAMIALAVRDDDVFSHDTCRLTALAMQYLFGVIFMLYGLEALHVFTVLTDVVLGDRTFVGLKTALAIAWGFPAVVIGITGATAYSRLMSDFSCWINAGDQVMLATFVPVATVAWPTVVLLEATGYGLTHRQSPSVTSCRLAHGGLMLVFATQFASWFMSWTAIYHQRISLFTVVFGVNVLLGILIYVYHVFSNEKARQLAKKLWGRLCKTAT